MSGQTSTCHFTLQNIHDCQCGVCAPLRRLIGRKRPRVRRPKPPAAAPDTARAGREALPPSDRD